VQEKRQEQQIAHPRRCIERADDEHGPRVRINLASGKQVVTDTALYSVGRTGATSRRFCIRPRKRSTG